MCKPCVYEILNTTNNKRYIGHTVNFTLRKNTHLSLLRNNKHTNKHLQAAWNKYGKDVFTISILEELDSNKALLQKREQHFMDLFKSCENGYNKAPSSKSRVGVKDSEQTKLAKSKAQLNRFKAKEERAKCGGKVTKQHKDAISKKLSGRTRSEHSKLMRDKTINKGAFKKGHGGTNNRRVKCINSGITYASIAAAARALRLIPQSIGKVCRGINNKTGGYEFRYED